jgi:hypothetical protein
VLTGRRAPAYTPPSLETKPLPRNWFRKAAEILKGQGCCRETGAISLFPKNQEAKLPPTSTWQSRDPGSAL